MKRSYRRRLLFGALNVLVLASLGNQSFAQSQQQPNCPYSEHNWLETKMFMGLSRSGGAAVSKREWDQFVANNFVVEFPYGFTIIETTGYWQDQTTKSTIYENGKEIVILHEATPDNEAKINEIADKFRSRFDQQSVLISSRKTNVRFCEQP